MGELRLHPKLTDLAVRFRDLDAERDKTGVGLIAPDLASYLPFVGDAWGWGHGKPSSRTPRVIVYGMAQNLAGHPDEVKAYLKTDNRGLTRLHDKWVERTSLGIRPWQTMHAQVIVAFALRALEKSRGLEPAQGCVTGASAYTNFVKWSSQKGRWGVRSKKVADQPPRSAAYLRAQPYVCAEVEALQPDLLIALGGDAAKALARCALSVPVVQVRHSSGLVINPLRGIGRALTEAPPRPALQVDPPALVQGWMTTLAGLVFRAGNDEGSTVQTPDQVRAALVKDWLYYALAERQIAEAIAAKP